MSLEKTFLVLVVIILSNLLANIKSDIFVNNLKSLITEQPK